MDPQAFNAVVVWISNYGYFFILLAMIAEGPVVTTAAAFAAALGVFNIYAIYFLSVLGDVIADVLYFTIGYWGRRTLLDKYGHYIGLTRKRMKRIEELLHIHAWKTLVTIKLTPTLSPPGLITAGVSRMPLKRYVIITTAIIVPKCLFFVLLGYYSGQAHNYAVKYLHTGQYAILIAFAIIVLISLLYQKISTFVGKKIEEI